MASKAAADAALERAMAAANMKPLPTANAAATTTFETSQSFKTSKGKKVAVKDEDTDNLKKKPVFSRSGTKFVAPSSYIRQDRNRSQQTHDKKPKPTNLPSDHSSDSSDHSASSSSDDSIDALLGNRKHKQTKREKEKEKEPPAVVASSIVTGVPADRMAKYASVANKSKGLVFDKETGTYKRDRSAATTASSFYASPAYTKVAKKNLLAKSTMDLNQSAREAHDESTKHEPRCRRSAGRRRKKVAIGSGTSSDSSCSSTTSVSDGSCDSSSDDDHPMHGLSLTSTNLSARARRGIWDSTFPVSASDSESSDTVESESIKGLSGRHRSKKSGAGAFSRRSRSFGSEESPSSRDHRSSSSPRSSRRMEESRDRYRRREDSHRRRHEDRNYSRQMSSSRERSDDGIMSSTRKSEEITRRMEKEERVRMMREQREHTKRLQRQAEEERERVIMSSRHHHNHQRGRRHRNARGSRAFPSSDEDSSQSEDAHDDVAPAPRQMRDYAALNRSGVSSAATRAMIPVGGGVMHPGDGGDSSSCSSSGRSSGRRPQQQHYQQRQRQRRSSVQLRAMYAASQSTKRASRSGEFGEFPEVHDPHHHASTSYHHEDVGSSSENGDGYQRPSAKSVTFGRRGGPSYHSAHSNTSIDSVEITDVKTIPNREQLAQQSQGGFFSRLFGRSEASIQKKVAKQQAKEDRKRAQAMMRRYEQETRERDARERQRQRPPDQHHLHDQQQQRQQMVQQSRDNLPKRNMEEQLHMQQQRIVQQQRQLQQQQMLLQQQQELEAEGALSDRSQRSQHSSSRISRSFHGAPPSRSNDGSGSGSGGGYGYGRPNSSFHGADHSSRRADDDDDPLDQTGGTQMYKPKLKNSMMQNDSEYNFMQRPAKPNFLRSATGKMLAKDPRDPEQQDNQQFGAFGALGQRSFSEAPGQRVFTRSASPVPSQAASFYSAHDGSPQSALSRASGTPSAAASASSFHMSRQQTGYARPGSGGGGGGPAMGGRSNSNSSSRQPFMSGLFHGENPPARRANSPTPQQRQGVFRSDTMTTQMNRHPASPPYRPAGSCVGSSHSSAHSGRSGGGAQTSIHSASGAGAAVAPPVTASAGHRSLAELGRSMTNQPSTRGLSSSRTFGSGGGDGGGVGARAAFSASSRSNLGLAPSMQQRQNVLYTKRQPTKMSASVGGGSSSRSWMGGGSRMFPEEDDDGSPGLPVVDPWSHR